MKFRANKMLGLAIGERSILVAEVSTAGETCQVTRAATFGYTETATSASSPQVLGEALGQFLKQEGYSSKAAIFGIPAKWVLTKSKELPPVDPALAADVLRLQVESEFSVEIKDLVYDYAGQSSASAPSRVLLAATPLRHVELVQAIASAARLDIQGITPTTVALPRRPRRDRAMRWSCRSRRRAPNWRGSAGPARRCCGTSGPTAAVTANVAGEVRRASLLLAAPGGNRGNGSANGHAQGQVVVWDDGIVDPAARRRHGRGWALRPAAATSSSLGVGDARRRSGLPPRRSHWRWRGGTEAAAHRLPASAAGRRRKKRRSEPPRPCWQLPPAAAPDRRAFRVCRPAQPSENDSRRRRHTGSNERRKARDGRRDLCRHHRIRKELVCRQPALPRLPGRSHPRFSSQWRDFRNQLHDARQHERVRSAANRTASTDRSVRDLVDRLRTRAGQGSALPGRRPEIGRQETDSCRTGDFVYDHVQVRARRTAAAIVNWT